MNPSILVVGSVTIDQVGDELRLGGVVTYAGATFARLGCRVAAAFRAPEDMPWIPERLRSLGIEPLRQESSGITRFVHTLAADGGRMLRVPEVAPPIGLLAPVLDWSRNAHLHLGPLHPGDLAPEWLALRASPVTIDLQGFLRRIDESGRISARVSPLARDALRAASLVKTSEDELAALLDQSRSDPAALLVRHRVRELVVTCGARGGYVLTAKGDRFNYAAEPAAGPVDPTGAGDVFFAAWLVERVHRGTDLEQSCRRAARLASLQVTGEWIRHDEIGVDSDASGERNSRL